METGNSHVSGTTFLCITSTDRDAILPLTHLVVFFFLNLIQYFSKSLKGQLTYVFIYERCSHHKPLKFISSETLDRVIYSSIYSLNQGSYMSSFNGENVSLIPLAFQLFLQRIWHSILLNFISKCLIIYVIISQKISLFSCLYIVQWLIAFCCPEIREVILLPTFTIILLTRIGNENFTFNSCGISGLLKMNLPHLN